jgi:hypothetical protein
MIGQLKIDFEVLDAAVEMCLPGYVPNYGSPDGHGLVSFKREAKLLGQPPSIHLARWRPKVSFLKEGE